MKKICVLTFVILISLFYKSDLVVASSYPKVHYDVHSIWFKEAKDSMGEFIYVSGWAMIRDTDHHDPSYTLILTDQRGNSIEIPETKGYNDVEKTSLTCIQYDKPSGYPWCFSVLNGWANKAKNGGGTGYGGSTGIDGVSKLIEATRFNGSNFYDNVGFSFKIYLDQFNCELKTMYTMRIKVSSEGKTETSDSLKVLKERIDPRLTDLFVSSYSDGTIKCLADSGLVQGDPDSGVPNSIGNYFTENEIFNIRKSKNANLYFQYLGDAKRYYYGIFYYEVQITKNLLYALASNSSNYWGWMPGSWGLVTTKDNRPTSIIFPCPSKVDPETEDIALNCSSSDAKISRTKAEKRKAFSNSACYVTCNEKIDVTLPKRPASIEASRGFAYDVNYKTNRSCTMNYTSVSPSPDKTACDNWNVVDYIAAPNNVLNIEGSDYFENYINKGSIVLDEVDRKVIRLDRLNGGYDITYRLPQTYIESGTGKIYFNNKQTSKVADGGRNFYTDKFSDLNKKFNLDFIINGLGNFNKWNITYDCDYDTYNNPFEDDPDDPKGGSPEMLFRPISLISPFPGRDPGANWKAYTNLISKNKNGSPVYSESNVMYEVTIKPTDIQEIRRYNRDEKKMNYLDNSLDSNGKSEFIHKTFAHLFDRR
jgi:hypothetical protein